MIVLLCRIKNKLSKVFWSLFFQKYTNNKNKITVQGKIRLSNPNIKCGKNVTIYEGVVIFGDGCIEIGDNVSIGNYTMIYASSNGGGIKIGSDTQIAGQCYIIDTDHGTASGELITRQKCTSSPIEIGNDVWIAAGCKVLRGSKINDGAVVGAMSLVKGEVEGNAISAGIPAKIIKKRES